MTVKLFKCENGHLYRFPEKSCVFCEHCSDIFYDYSHGPYMLICDLGINTDNGNLSAKCMKFREDFESPNIIYVEEE